MPYTKQHNSNIETSKKDQREKEQWAFLLFATCYFPISVFTAA